MIGLLTGVLLEKQPPSLLIAVSGVGYEVDAPMSTFCALPDINSSITLWTHLAVREDAHQLYGFLTQEERVLFRTLLKVNGVGPRLALTILSSATPTEFSRMVLNNDTANLVRLPGIGKKTAERLVIEMRDKLTDKTLLSHPRKLGGRQSVLQDAISALVALGFKQAEANRFVTKVDDGKSDSQDLIRWALKEVAV
jgi:Holliday junction DNA helicase RuvA